MNGYDTDLTAPPPFHPQLPPDPYGPRTGHPLPPTIDPQGDYPWDTQIRTAPPRTVSLPELGNVTVGAPLSEPPGPAQTAPAPTELRRAVDFAKAQHFVFTIPANQVSGVDLALGPGWAAGPVPFPTFHAWRLLVDNPTPYTLWLPDASRYVPPGVYGYPVMLRPALFALRVQVAQGSAAIGAVSVPVVIMALDALVDVGQPVEVGPVANLLGQGNNGAALSAESVWLNEGGVFAALRGAAAEANGSALDGAANAIPPGATPASVTSAANAAGVLAIPAVAGQTNRLMVLAVSASAVSTAAGNLTISFGGVTWTVPLAVGAIGGASTAIVQIPLPAGGVAATAVNTAIVVTSPALGAAITSTINAAYVVG